MEMMYCPYWQDRCVKEKCSAFEFEDVCLWNGLDSEKAIRYKHFEKTQKTAWAEDEKIWYAVGIPFCRTMKIEIPMRVKK